MLNSLSILYYIFLHAHVYDLWTGNRIECEREQYTKQLTYPLQKSEILFLFFKYICKYVYRKKFALKKRTIEHINTEISYF